MSRETSKLHEMQRIMIIGNGGGGKTTLSVALSKHTGIPVTEVDALQFLPNWQRRPATELHRQLEQIENSATWIIDGFGAWDNIVNRAEHADTIIFVDHPIWVHFWWACERQISVAFGQPRLGGPEGCDLRDKTKEMFQTIWWVHEELRPKLVALFEQHREKRIWIRSPEELETFLQSLSG
jgi:adenylate kinase family enzyme